MRFGDNEDTETKATLKLIHLKKKKGLGATGWHHVLSDFDFNSGRVSGHEIKPPSDFSFSTESVLLSLCLSPVHILSLK